MTEAPDLTISELRKITELVKEKYNYDFSNYAASSFKRRLQRIMELKKIGFDQLCIQIANQEISRQSFVNEITVNVTEMFRDPSFWKTLRQMLPEILSQRDKIRIWHAGCSSGEEVYSMLILLDELKILDKVEIIASDIDTGILQKAKEGKISIKNMELNESNYTRFGGEKTLSSYFVKTPDYAYFDKKYIEKVSFREIDLVKAQAFTKCDFVLCRNVLIYFNQVLQNNVLKLFAECMFMGGYLAIGGKESIAWCDVASRFSTINLEEKIYKKIKD
jgi:chemotaxis protein methyltransferase CheR